MKNREIDKIIGDKNSKEVKMCIKMGSQNEPNSIKEEPTQTQQQQDNQTPLILKTVPLNPKTVRQHFLALSKPDRKEEMIKILKKHYGLVSHMCAELGIHNDMYYDYIKEDEDFAYKVEQINEANKDFVESKLYEQIRDGNFVSTIFYLKTKARDRGYTEQQENKQVIEVKINQQIPKTLPIQQNNQNLIGETSCE